MNERRVKLLKLTAFLGVLALMSASVFAQFPDKTQTPNAANEGINKSLTQQIGAGRGNIFTPDSSAFIIARDPFRAVRRGRQLFQRKFTRAQGQGPLTGDGQGDIENTLIIGAGLADSCAACHGQPRGSAGAGGDVVTRPDSRNAPHLFGLGLKEMLADEITDDLRDIRDDAISDARRDRRTVTRSLNSKGINYGTITADRNGNVDTSGVRGIDPPSVFVRFLHGETISIRSLSGRSTPRWARRWIRSEEGKHGLADRYSRRYGAGWIWQCSEAPPTDGVFADPDGAAFVTRSRPASWIYEFYLLHFQGRNRRADLSTTLVAVFQQIGCATCHIPDLRIDRDRRVADVETVFDPTRGNPFNRMFATATAHLFEIDDRRGFPTLKKPNLGDFLVKNIFTDFKRHDLGSNFHEINYNGTLRTQMLTMALWGVGTTAPYGHDGRSITLNDVTLRHGGEAVSSRNNFAGLSSTNRRAVLDFLNSLTLFPPDDTASNLDPGDLSAANYPQFGHGSIRLTALFNDTTDVE
jgi:hypothetical protein